MHQERIMIADFGLSKDLDNSSISLAPNRYGIAVFIDSKCFLDEHYHHDKKSDIFSLRILFWEILKGLPPFDSFNNYVIPSKIMNGKRELPVKGTPLAYIELYQKCWDKELNNWPDIQEVFKKFKQIPLQDQDNNNQLGIKDDINDNKSFQTSNNNTINIIQYSK